MLQSESKDYKGPISQLQQSADKSSLLLSLFMLFGASIDWPRPTCIREGKLLYSVCTLTITFDQMGTPGPVQLTQKTSHHAHALAEGMAGHLKPVGASFASCPELSPTKSRTAET